MPLNLALIVPQTAPSRPRRNAPFIPMSQAQGLSGAAFGNVDAQNIIRPTFTEPALYEHTEQIARDGATESANKNGKQATTC